jgi:hypothetical protein
LALLSTTSLGCGVATTPEGGGVHALTGGASPVVSPPVDRAQPVPEHVHHYGARVSHAPLRSVRR